MKPPLGARGLLVAVAVVTVLTAAGVLVAERLRPAPAPAVRANARPSALPAGPGGAAEVVVGPDGAQIFCPSGAAPTITVNDAAFEPALSDGRSFTAGKYRIRLRGLVINETTASIAVDTYVVRVGDTVWPATVHGPATVQAGGADELTVEATYDSTGPTQASVHVTMQWVWSATALRPCGKRGLVEDD
ncbi:hypothetical protein AB0K00_52220 [Dactylosporangium sp. NPDC049525]|uniref:hypothetical protein n=1 Tax=Dactylosporangium sp. NPDC049525 TaxID=3154730 RepID=UPI00341F39AA